MTFQNQSCRPIRIQFLFSIVILGLIPTIGTMAHACRNVNLPIYAKNSSFQNTDLRIVDTAEGIAIQSQTDLIFYKPSLAKWCVKSTKDQTTLCDLKPKDKITLTNPENEKQVIGIFELQNGGPLAGNASTPPKVILHSVKNRQDPDPSRPGLQFTLSFQELDGQNQKTTSPKFKNESDVDEILTVEAIPSTAPDKGRLVHRLMGRWLAGPKKTPDFSAILIRETMTYSAQALPLSRDLRADGCSDKSIHPDSEKSADSAD